jgi:hypothetical protein
MIMNQAERWAKRARKHVRALSQGIGPRGATSDGERRAAEYVRDELGRLGLRDVRLESFRGAVSTWMPWSIAFSIAAWGVFIGLLFDLVGGLVASALYLVAAWIVYRELYPPAGLASASPPARRSAAEGIGRTPLVSGLSVRRWLWRGDSQNVVGVVPPAGAVERRLVLMGYLDSARAPFFWRARARRRLAGCMVLPLFLSLLLNAVALLLGAVTGSDSFYFVAFLLVFPQVVALLASLRAGRSSFSPGANNNASGVGTLLALAERLKEAPLARTEVWLLATGCRETGGDGIRAFLEAHGETLAEATFVALEGVGVGERAVYLAGEGALRGTSYPSQALALAARAAERCREEGLGIGAERHRGGPTEMGLIVRRGFEGLAINVWPGDWAGVASRRRMDDTFDTIEEEALAQVHIFAWALLQEIDTEQ